MRRLTYWGIQIGLSSLLVFGAGSVFYDSAASAAEYVNSFQGQNGVNQPLQGGYPPMQTVDSYSGSVVAYPNPYPNQGTVPPMYVSQQVYATSVGGSQGVPQQAVPQHVAPPDAALVLASKSMRPTPPPVEEEKPKKSFFDFMSKKSTETKPAEAAKAPKERPKEQAVVVGPVDRPPTAAVGTANSGSSNKFKSERASGSQKPLIQSKKSKDKTDEGRAEVESLTKERAYSEVDYLASATTPEGTASQNLYNEGLLAESQGRLADATRLYTAFIAANEQATTNGVLASPYHRLALMSWKQGNVENTDVYFRYAINYALSGNLLIIAGDYAQFLMSKGDYPKAETILRNALISDPENKRLLFHLGRCVALQKKHQESLRYLTPAVGRDRAYQELAAIYRHQGEFALAQVAEQKRQEYLASKPAPYPAPPAGFSMQPQPAMQANAMPSQPGTVPYPPYGTMGQAVTATQQPQTPFPVIERPTVAYGAQAAPVNGGWQAVEPKPAQPMQPQFQPQTPTVSETPTTPVSKVYHYPANSQSPVYYQYTGNQYPGTGNPAAPSVPYDPWNAANAPQTPVLSNNPPQPNNVGWNANQPLPQ